MAYTMTTRVDASFEDAVESTTEALEDEGFGILSEIDVKTTLKQKLDVDVDDYRILGACNPPLAHEALDREPELGALLPCNVIVYEDGDDVVVSAVDPERLLDVTDSPDLDEVAAEVREMFQRALATVEEDLSVETEAR